MWPFRRRERGFRKSWENLIVGLVIGGAIGSIIGKKLLDEKNGDGKISHKSNEDDENIRT